MNRRAFQIAIVLIALIGAGQITAVLLGPEELREAIFWVALLLFVAGTFILGSRVKSKQDGQTLMVVGVAILVMAAIT